MGSLFSGQLESNDYCLYVVIVVMC